jgi:hypothetical protein
MWVSASQREPFAYAAEGDLEGGEERSSREGGEERSSREGGEESRNSEGGEETLLRREPILSNDEGGEKQQ